MCKAAPIERDRPDSAERPPQRLLPVGNEPAADERDTDPVQAVVQDPQDQQHVEREERQLVASRMNLFHAGSPHSSMDNTPRWRYR